MASELCYIILSSKGIQDVVIWLDNDNPEVNKQARRIRDAFKGFGLNVIREADLKDPKAELCKMPISQYNTLLEKWRQI